MSGAPKLPWFLQRLALDNNADQRAIRRAYAREVKLIDQGADAAGFQHLRVAYETALQWEEYQRYTAQDGGHGDEPDDANEVAAPGAGAGDAPPADYPPPADQAAAASAVQAAPQGAEPAPPAVSAAPAAPAPQSAGIEAAAAQLACAIDPQQLSADVFEAFMAGCSGLVQGRTLHDTSAWEQHLRTCLHDDRLMNLAARGIFEARIVHLLASGWRSGHETLLEAAADVFQWRSDRHRLRQFGRAGAMIDRGIDERSMFDNQQREHKAAQRRVIARLREMDTPEASQLRADMPHVEQLATRFPTWLELVANMDNVEQWRQAHAALPPDPRPAAAPEPAPDTAPAAPPKQRGRGSAGRILFWLLMATAALRFVNHEAGKPPASAPAGEPAQVRQRASAAATPKPAPAPAVKAVPQQAPPTTPPTKERIDEIGDRIRYRVTQMEKPGNYRVKYLIELDDKGRIAKVHLENGSGLPLYDAMVERSIRDTHPFPPGTSRRFTLSYGMQIFIKPRTPGREPAPPSDTAAPETPPQ